MLNKFVMLLHMHPEATRCGYQVYQETILMSTDQTVVSLLHTTMAQLTFQVLFNESTTAIKNGLLTYGWKTNATGPIGLLWVAIIKTSKTSTLANTSIGSI